MKFEGKFEHECHQHQGLTNAINLVMFYSLNPLQFPFLELVDVSQ